MEHTKTLFGTVNHYDASGHSDRGLFGEYNHDDD